jgi:hypothetical protein
MVMTELKLGAAHIVMTELKLGAAYIDPRTFIPRAAHAPDTT